MSSAASPTGFCRRSRGLRATGFLGAADAVMPTFTNPNNVSIVTGAPPAVHGIAGNYDLDRETGREVMITDDRLMRSPTILGLMSQQRCRDRRGHRQGQIAAHARTWARRHVLFVGMRRSRNRGDGRAPAARHVFRRSVAVRARCRAGAARVGARAAALSVALRLRAARPRAGRARKPTRFTEPSTSGFGSLSNWVRSSALTADHGMNDKPRVIFLEDELTGRFGAAAARVICPITDPFVRHHGALGSFVRVYARDRVNIAGDDGGRCRTARRRRGFRARPTPPPVSNCPMTARPILSCSATPPRRSAPPAPSTICRGSPAIACARMAARAKQRVPFMLSQPLTAEYRRPRRNPPLAQFRHLRLRPERPRTSMKIVARPSRRSMAAAAWPVLSRASRSEAANACAATDTTGRIEGTVTLACRSGAADCRERPYQTGLVLEDPRTGRPVAPIRVSASGRFAISASPGTYRIISADVRGACCAGPAAADGDDSSGSGRARRGAV